ncbi:hypothetical protein [Streptomyces djakartensis]|uniref:hypothetical protein n=1 Tax=Streptomyces djakartensis TaxID=68193 RepID=UPI00167DE7B8|nr:hypothetical protein [Streptomyces djakartensis]
MSIIAAVITGGFSSLLDALFGDQPDVVVSTDRDKPHVDPSSSRTGHDGNPEGHRSKVNQQTINGELGTAGVSFGSDGDLCSSDAWVYFKPPEHFRRNRKLPYPDYTTAADADSTVARLTIESKGDNAIQISEIKLKIVDRDKNVSPKTSTHLEFSPYMNCAASETPRADLTATATLDGPGNLRNTYPTAGENKGLPTVLHQGDFFEILLTVSTTHCACTWIPVIHWTADGERHTTELEGTGTTFRTAPTKGLKTVVFEPFSEGDSWVLPVN